MKLFNWNSELQACLRVIRFYSEYDDTQIINAITVVMEQYYSKLSSQLKHEISDRLFDMKWDSKYICTYVIGTRPNPGFYADQILWMGYLAAKEMFKGCWDIVDANQRHPDAVERFDTAFQSQMARDKA